MCIVQALMSAHDQVANKEYPLQSVMDDGDELMGEQVPRIVYIEKKSDPLVGISHHFNFLKIPLLNFL